MRACVRVCFRQGQCIRSGAVQLGVNSKCGNSTRQSNARGPLQRWGLRWGGGPARWPPPEEHSFCRLSSGPKLQKRVRLCWGRCDSSRYMLQTLFSWCFLLAVRNVCCVMWSEVLSLKLTLKDTSSLVSLEGSKSSISRTFKGQNHMFYKCLQTRSLLELFLEVRLLCGRQQGCLLVVWYLPPQAEEPEHSLSRLRAQLGAWTHNPGIRSHRLYRLRLQPPPAPPFCLPQPPRVWGLVPHRQGWRGGALPPNTRGGSALPVVILPESYKFSFFAFFSRG